MLSKQNNLNKNVFSAALPWSDPETSTPCRWPCAGLQRWAPWVPEGRPSSGRSRHSSAWTKPAPRPSLWRLRSKVSGCRRWGQNVPPGSYRGDRRWRPGCHTPFLQSGLCIQRQTDAQLFPENGLRPRKWLKEHFQTMYEHTMKWFNITALHRLPQFESKTWLHKRLKCKSQSWI